MKKSSTYNFLLAIIVTSSSLVFALGLAEIVVRVFDIGPEINPVYSENYALSENKILGYELVANSSDGENFINADGLRDKDYSKNKPKQVFRIAVAGDSITFGSKVSQGQAYSKYIERLLNLYTHNEVKYEVINFGVEGYNSKQVVEKIKAKALEYQPDLIIYGYCLNDPQEYSLEMMNLLKKKDKAQDAISALPNRSRLFMLVKYFLGRDSEIRQSIEKTLAEDFKAIDNSEDPQWHALRVSGDFVEYFQGLYRQDQYWGRTQQDLDKLQTISAEAGTPVALVVFPLLQGLDDYQLGDIHSQISEAGRKRGMYVYDLKNPFEAYERQSERPLGADSLHLLALTHSYTAVALINFLQEESLLPGISRHTLDLMKMGNNDQLSDFVDLVQQP